jgi:cytochrome oxidase assembly protein ShyY1
VTNLGDDRGVVARQSRSLASEARGRRKKKRTISGKKSGQKNRKGFLQGFDATAAGGMHLHRAKTVADLNGLHFARNCAR